MNSTSLPLPAQSAPFDTIRHVRDDRSEFWSARDLQVALGYVEWRKFSDAIERARLAAINAGADRVEDHFVGAAKMVELGSGSQRIVNDFHLSRYASYLVAMNGDPHKPEIAAAQHYFAVRTREAEMGPQGPTREGSYLEGYRAGRADATAETLALVERLGGRVARSGHTSQPRTNRSQPIPTYHRKGDGLPVKIAPWVHPKIAAAHGDILAMPTPVGMNEIFAMLREEHGVQRNRGNEMGVSKILKDAGLLRRKISQGKGQVWVYVRE